MPLLKWLKMSENREEKNLKGAWKENPIRQFWYSAGCEEIK